MRIAERVFRIALHAGHTAATPPVTDQETGLSAMIADVTITDQQTVAAAASAIIETVLPV